MTISPLDVRNQIFKKKMRGYDIDEVKMFLDAVADYMEELLKQKETLEQENSALKQKADTFTDIESTLRDTMVTAQKICDEAKVNAQKEAENITRKAELDGQHKMAEAMKEVEKLARAREDARSQTVALVAKLRSLLEAQLSFLGSIEGEIRVHDAQAGERTEVREGVGS